MTKTREMTNEELNTLVSDGVLYAVNRLVLHPLGFALCFQYENNGTIQIKILKNEGPVEPWTFDDGARLDGANKLSNFLLTRLNLKMWAPNYAYLDRIALPKRLTWVMKHYLLLENLMVEADEVDSEYADELRDRHLDELWSKLSKDEAKLLIERESLESRFL